MIDRDEPSVFEPRLPEDPAYWSALANQITHNADPVFTELDARRTWWSPLDRFGPVFSIGAIAAAAAMFVVLPAGTPPAARPDAPVSRPTDLLDNVFRTPAAPDVMTLMVLGNEEPQ